MDILFPRKHLSPKRHFMRLCKGDSAKKINAFWSELQSIFKKHHMPLTDENYLDFRSEFCSQDSTYPNHIQPKDLTRTIMWGYNNTQDDPLLYITILVKKQEKGTPTSKTYGVLTLFQSSPNFCHFRFTGTAPFALRVAPTLSAETIKENLRPIFADGYQETRAVRCPKSDQHSNGSRQATYSFQYVPEMPETLRQPAEEKKKMQ